MKKILISLSILVFLSAFISACDISAPQPTAKPSETPLPTFTLTTAPTDTPAPTYTPIPPTESPSSFPEIKTTNGNLVIDKVEFSSQDMFGAPAPDGEQFLTIWLVRSDGNDVDVVYFLQIQPVSSEIYLIYSDGTRSQISGIGYWEEKLWVRFTVSNSKNGFQFLWPDNPAIDLEK